MSALNKQKQTLLDHNKNSHTIIPASYLVLIRDNQVLLLRSCNTGYEDGHYSLIAGHVEAGETFTDTAIREGFEEAGITIRPEDLSVVNVMHRIKSPKTDERVDTFFLVKKWEGEIVNKEAAKCSDLSWFPLEDLPDNVIPYIRHALDNIQKGVFYSEEKYKNPWIRVREDQVIHPDGKPGIFGIVEYQPGLSVLPIDDYWHHASIHHDYYLPDILVHHSHTYIW